MVNLECFVFAANVHGVREELQVHITQYPAYDQLHAALPGGDSSHRHSTRISVRLHLHTPTGYTPAQCCNREKKGKYSVRIGGSALPKVCLEAVLCNKANSSSDAFFVAVKQVRKQ